MEQLNSNLKIAVIGPGGIGGLLAILTKMAGHEVVCIDSSTTQDYTKKSLQLCSPIYGNHIMEIPFASALVQPVDIIFITVKAPFLESALQRVSSLTKDTAIAISLLNGIGHQELLKKNFSKVIIGTIGLIETEQTRKYFIEHRSKNPAYIEIASNSIVTKKKLRLIAELIKDLGIRICVKKNETEVIWNKLTRLCPIASATSYFQTSLGEILINTQQSLIIDELIFEVSQIAKLESYEANPIQIRKQIEKLPFNLKTSLQKDLMNKKTSEIEAILGDVSRIFRRNFQRTSILGTVYDELVNRK